jgi:hypothetical protein
MSAVAVAIGGAAVAGLAGAYMTSKATSDAADRQASAANYAANLQNQQFEQTRADQQPWRTAGASALTQMQDPSFQHDFGMSDFQADPGYQFRLQQAQDAIQRSAAASGSLGSGSTLKALTQYSQDYASNEYQNAYNRFTNNQTSRFNRLASLAGLGQTANGVTAQAGMNAANQIGGYMTGAANAQGAAGIASANAWGGALTGTANTGMQGLFLNRMFPQKSAEQAPEMTMGGEGTTITPMGPPSASVSPYMELAEQ